MALNLKMRRMGHIACVKDFEEEKVANNIRIGEKMN
jgi:hypothetical protein